MSPPRVYADNAERQRAYRERQRAALRNGAPVSPQLSPDAGGFPAFPEAASKGDYAGFSEQEKRDDPPQGYSVADTAPPWWYATDGRGWGEYHETRADAVTACWAHQEGAQRV
jgi:hypothetical protein